MPYCEECGAKLSDGVQFCEECGAKVEFFGNETSTTVSADSKCNDRLSTFKGDWTSKWKHAAQQSGGEELGVILTDLDSLSSQLHCTQSSLLDVVEDYICSASGRGVQYHLLDLSQNNVANTDGEDVQSIVNLLTKVVTVARPKYVFILGNEEIMKTYISFCKINNS